ncbi:MAG: spondin domain-containing protein [Bdellovibrionota bacterium]|nr:spondin domain-containing protein [Bdellovibrionota bacterium]
MKKLLLTMAISSLATSAMSYDRIKKFQVTVQNLTKGQPLTPVLLTVHTKKSAPLFIVGEKASEGLSLLAKDGMTAPLKKELSSKMTEESILIGEGVILPGKKQEIVFETSQRSPKISLVSMLARTNDAFIGLSELKLRSLRKGKKSFLANVYDAGAEENTESCAHIPAPPCNSPGMNTDSAEGFVRPHEGISGSVDLNALRDQFSNKAAKVTITRIH